jgi:very-short-patch-repair endonuclease
MLRKNMTKEKRHLWYDFLRYCKPRFRRQEIIGSYIADFFCEEAKLVIELDGSQHYETEGIVKDNARSAYFRAVGLKVLRFSNRDVNLKFDSVCQAIVLVLKQCHVDPIFDFERESKKNSPAE